MPIPPMTTPQSAPATSWPHEGVARQVLLSLQAPAWAYPAADAAGAPLVVVGYDHTGPGGATPEPGLPGAPAGPDWAAGLAADDPFARLLAGWGPAASEGVWFS